MEPAHPPERMFLANFSYCGASFAVLNIALTVSLKAKFKAWVGKYLNTLAKLPVNQSSFLLKTAFNILTTSETMLRVT